MQWGTVPDWISAVATLGTLVIAWVALSSWREQLKGASVHAVAEELAVAARSLKYAFYGARSPMFWAGEFPESYSKRYENREKPRHEIAEEFRHAYANRWKTLWPHIELLATLRSKAGAVLGDEIAQLAEDLAKKARELRFMMDEDIEQKRVGPDVVKRWSDQEFHKRVRDSVVSHEAQDPLSKEFDAALDRLLLALKSKTK